MLEVIVFKSRTALVITKLYYFFSKEGNVYALILDQHTFEAIFQQKRKIAIIGFLGVMYEDIGKKYIAVDFFCKSEKEYKKFLQILKN